MRLVSFFLGIMLSISPVSAQEERAALSVSVAAYEVTRGPVTEWVFLEGIIAAASKEYLQFRVPGRVIEIAQDDDGAMLRAGRAVRQNQILARLDDDDARADLERAEAALSSAQERVNAASVVLAEAELQFSRQQQLVERGVAAAAALEQAEAARDTAQAQMLEAQVGVTAARVDRDAAQLGLNRTVLRAPFDGVITRINIREGDEVAAGFLGASEAEREANAALVLIDASQVEVVLAVPPYLAPQLAEGQPAWISALPTAISAEIQGDAPSAAVARGHIWSLSPAISRATRSVDVRVRADGLDGELRDGDYVSVWVEVGRNPDALRVPYEAVADRQGQLSTFVIDEGVVASRSVETGLSGIEWLEITSGLSEGDQIVTRGQHLLSDGFAVTVVEPAQ